MLQPRRVIAVIVLAFLSGFPVVSAAQESINYASVSGRVQDTSGAVLPGATVTARQIETNVSTVATTDPDGRFRLAYLKVGTYELQVSEPGFNTSSTRLTLNAGAAFELPFTLSVAAVASTITVTADAAVLETSRSQIASTVSRTEVSTLPMNGRNFLDLALLVPGASPTNVGGGTQIFPETSAVPGVGLSVSSQRNLSNNFMVDGLSANDDAAALSGMSYGVDAVDQFQVITSGGQAEMGRALGGYVNVVTRSGTNALAGTTYGFFRDDRFNAANPLLTSLGQAANHGTLPMHQNQYGTSLGGPIVHDRTFFFANVEQRRLDQSGLVTVPQDIVDTINARLRTVGYGGPAVTTGLYPNPVDTTNAVAKVDHTVSAADHVNVRYSQYDVSSRNARGAGGTATPSSSAGIDNVDRTIAAGNVWAGSSRAVLESRAQVAYSNLAAPPADAIGPSVSIAGVASFGTLSGAPTGRVNTMYELVNNLTLQAGAHAVRAGVDVLYNDVTITYPRSVRGSYSFSNLANFLAGTYTNTGYTQTFGDTVVAQTNPNLGLYLQDEWHAGAHVTVNAGVRYDLQYLQTIETDRDNVAPRVGIVWSPGGAQHAVVRANVGRFYDRVPLRAVANALLSAGNTTNLSALRQIGVTLAPAQAGAPVFPNTLGAVVPTTALVNFTTMDRRLQNAHSDQASVEFEQSLGPAGTLSVDYQHLRGRHLLMSLNQNVPTCAVSGTNNGCRPISSYANNSQYSAAGSSDYDALQIALVRRPAAWGSYRLSYSLSKSMNDVGEAFFSAPLDPTDVSRDWGRSDDDQRHRLTVLGSVNSPMTPAASLRQKLTHGFQASALVQFYSALPFNITTGANTIQGTPARPTVDGEFIPRNAGEGSAFSTVSLRISRGVRLGHRAKLDGLIEVFNLFNHRNDVARITVFGTGVYPTAPAATFGDVTVVGDPRSAQFGFRLSY
jgi:hypothetical protein